MDRRNGRKIEDETREIAAAGNGGRVLVEEFYSLTGPAELGTSIVRDLVDGFDAAARILGHSISRGRSRT